jgi:hypothetical protein
LVQFLFEGIECDGIISRSRQSYYKTELFLVLPNPLAVREYSVSAVNKNHVWMKAFD